jgi:L-seryl-tRNA(Ser) seleniumtransferase
VRIDGLTPNRLELKLRSNEPPIIGRIEDDAFLMDARTLQVDEAPVIAAALKSILTGC